MVIAGVSKPEQVIASTRGAQWKLTREEVAEVRAILEPGGEA